MKRLYTFLVSFTCIISALWALGDGESFKVNIEHVDDISEAPQSIYPVDFVYGNKKQKKSGYAILVEPHPERVYKTRFPHTFLSDQNFTVWITAGRIDGPIWTSLDFFRSGGQKLKYLSIFRKDISLFALFISDEELESFRKIDTNGEIVNEIFLEFSFAVNNEAQWPLDKAHTSAGLLKDEYPTFRLTHRPKINLLNVQMEAVDDGSKYMEKHPEKDYFFKELDHYSEGWFFHMDYQNKNILRQQVHDSHYVIFTLWKDEKHTQPLTFSYTKNNLWIGGFDNDTSNMEERYNYVAYPHKNFDDWSLFVPEQAIDYWKKDGITPTKENHTCKAYYTLTLSNDGKASATANPYEYSGWIAQDLYYDEDEEEDISPKTEETESTEIENNTCLHQETEIGIMDRGEYNSFHDGCIKDFKRYEVWESCKICGSILYSFFFYEPIGTRCLSHNLKEVDRTHREITMVVGCNITETTVNDIIYMCQNECCNYKTTISMSDVRQDILSSCKCPPHKWEEEEPTKVREESEYHHINGELWIYYYDIMEQKRTCTHCQLVDPINRWRVLTHKEKVESPIEEKEEQQEHLHQWVYYSNSYRSETTTEQQIGKTPAFDKDSLLSTIDSVKFSLVKNEKRAYVCTSPVNRQQWLALFSDNNYMGLPKDDAGFLNNITYQEAFDFIKELNKEATEKLNLNMRFSLPSVEEMRTLINTEQLDKRQLNVQNINCFFVDSVEVYDGKGRLLTDAQLSTAPEGAKVRVMVGALGLDGQLNMVDISTAKPNIGFFLKAVPFEAETTYTIARPGKLYKIYKRQCTTCGKLEILSENIFHNMRYHRPLFNQ